jgi:integrase
MGTVKLPYVERNVAKGRIYYRYRRDGLRIPLPCDPMSHEFMEAYQRTHKSFENGNVTPRAAPGTIGALVEAFKKSAEFTCLKPRVRMLYLSNLDLIVDRLGKFPAQKLTRRVVLEWQDSLSETPAKANNLIKSLSRIYSFGINRGMVTQNPATGVKKLKIGEWRPWTLDEVGKFKEKAPAAMRLAFHLGLFTGQRLGDVIKMRWDQIHDDGIEVTQEKTGEKIWVPLHQELKAVLDDMKADAKADTAILLTPSGEPYKADHFKHSFKDAMRQVGLPDGCVFHGLRKTAAVMLAEAGCSTEQIKAITGHRTDQMVSYYAKRANQKILARAAMKKLEG